VVVSLGLVSRRTCESRRRATHAGVGDGEGHTDTRAQPEREAADGWATMGYGWWVMGEEAGRLRVRPVKKGNELRNLFNLFTIHRKKIKSKEIARCLQKIRNFYSR
jgi:hypothetical protein